MARAIVELREVVQKLVPLLTGKGLEVTQRGSQAYVSTDPKTRKPVRVNIPNISDNASDGFVRAVQGFIDHEVAHVLITDWNYYGGAPSKADLQKPEVQKLMNCHNVIEDTMIEREIVKIFPGSKKNIGDLREHFIRKVTMPAVKQAKSKEEKFSYLMVPTMRALAGHEEFQEFMDKEDHWENPMVKSLVGSFSAQTLESLKTAETTEQTLAIAKDLYDILYNKPKPPEENKGPSQDKPEKEAGEGDGDGERDHSQSEGDEPENDENSEEKGEQDGDSQSDEGSKEENSDEESDDLDTSEESENDAETEEGIEDGDDSDAEKEPGDDPGIDEDATGEDTDDDADDGENSSDEAGDDDSEGSGKSNGASDDDADESEEPIEGGDVDESDTGSDSSSGDTTDTSKPDNPDVTEKTDGAVDESDAEAPSGNNDESDGGNGVGAGEAKSMFEFEEDVLEGKDLSEEMMVLISQDAVESIRHSDWSVFTREWDKIESPNVPAKINSSWVPDMEDEVRSMTGRMQKDIERIMASQSHVVNQPGHKRGRLHSPSLYRVAQNDPRVFTQRQEHRSKDTAVTLLADNSGSMSGQKMKAAMLASYALSTTLNRVDISHEMMGFTTGSYYGMPQNMLDELRKDCNKTHIDYDRTIPLVMPIYKAFDERLDATVKKRVAYAMNAQVGLNGNMDGECLQIAAERLARRPEKRKVMIVLSDGQPVGGVNAGPHLKGTVEHLNKNGIETIGIGIMSKAVRNFYKNYVVLNDVSELPGQVMSEIKRILA